MGVMSSPSEAHFWLPVQRYRTFSNATKYGAVEDGDGKIHVR
jgi:hypothetical protein